MFARHVSSALNPVHPVHPCLLLFAPRDAWMNRINRMKRRRQESIASVWRSGLGRTGQVQQL